MIEMKGLLLFLVAAIEAEPFSLDTILIGPVVDEKVVKLPVRLDLVHGPSVERPH